MKKVKESARKPVILVVMDGWGLRKKGRDNAITLAKTPVMDRLLRKYPSAVLAAAETAVGLPKGQMGNSEVGHMNLGAGRIVEQEFMLISKEIRRKSFFGNKALIDGMKGKTVHMMGLLSDGGIHSHITHLYALLKLAKKFKKRVCLHAFLDGRDTEPACAARYLADIKKKLEGRGEIATISGRYYAMDRDNRWERVEKAYLAIADANGVFFPNAEKALEESYKSGVTDEFVKPCLTSASYKGVRDGDSVIFFNFREDRARQLTRAFVDEEFRNFPRNRKNVIFVCMTEYDKKIKDVKVAFSREPLPDILGEIVSKRGMAQLRVAETEKYAHVTYFFNTLREEVFPKEDRIMIPSQKVATYDLKPEMSAQGITDAVVKAINSGKYSLIVLNYANGDMVGHTGVLKATIKAVETVDKCVGKVVDAMLAKDGVIAITADHGNCEVMSGKEQTSHTISPVPFLLVSNKKMKINKRGVLGNVAPTILDIYGIPKPKEMMKSLIVE